MKTIEFKVGCNLKNKKYEVGDVFNPTKEDFKIINKLNEKGFIQPLTKEEIKKIYKNLTKKRKKREE